MDAILFVIYDRSEKPNVPWLSVRPRHSIVTRSIVFVLATAIP
jgi:hypothetical protein